MKTRIARIVGGLVGVAVLALSLTSRSTAAQQGAIGTGGIKGTVHDSTGMGVTGVEITLAGSTFRAETDERGQFTLGKVPAGPLSLKFRRLGFRPDTIDLMVMAGQTIPLEVRLDRAPIRLAPVVIHGREALSGWRVGFYERLSHGGGHFVTRADIEQRNPGMLTDMFRSIPGARVVSVGIGFTRVIRFRGEKCAPITWLDGAPLSAGEFDLDALSPRSIEAMEVYAGPASVPMQFQTDRNLASACGAIIIWSREGELRAKKAKLPVSPATQLARLVDAKAVFTAGEVDAPAHQDSTRQVHPGYPAALYDSGVPGSVLAEFVVDASGEVNLDTFSVVYSTNPLFTDAVQRALRDAVYVPAVRKGYPVMQVVQHEFQFVPDASIVKRK